MENSGSHLPALAVILLAAAVTGMLLRGAALADADPAGAPGRRRYLPLVAAALALWLAYTGLIARRGLLPDPYAFPPPFLRVMGPGLLLTGLAAFSGFGAGLAKRLGYTSLVGFQAFRLPLEGLLWWLHRQGRLPVQMTLVGRNPDILTGISAVVLAVLLAKGIAGRKTVMIWNLAGLALLLNIAVVAVLSLPGRLRAFPEEPPNTIVLHFPFVWIPAVFVLAALLGHLIVFRRLRMTA